MLHYPKLILVAAVLLAAATTAPLATASDNPCDGQAPGPHCRPPCDDPANGCLGDLVPEPGCRIGPLYAC